VPNFKPGKGLKGLINREIAKMIAEKPGETDPNLLAEQV